MAIDITSRAENPKPIVPFPSEAAWDSTADGKRFLVSLPKGGKPEPYTVVLNSQEALKK